MNNRATSGAITALFVVSGLGALHSSSAFAGDGQKVLSGKEVLNTKCVACHQALPDGGLDRISEGRRTPEGWDMTVARMGYAHGVKLTADERKAVVKYLSDTYGLAPSEAVNHRFIIEKEPGVVEQANKFNDKTVVDTCSRCHSAARVGLQRRSGDDWQKLVDFHIGQFPAVEFQFGGRDREWYKIAHNDVSKILAAMQPVKSKAWDNWSKKEKASAEGQWIVTGHRPGWGDYSGTASIQRTGNDAYAIKMSITYENGKTQEATGQASVFTGYEWRASVEQDGDSVRQVFAMSEDGRKMNGRWYLTDHEDLGARFSAIRQAPDAKPYVLAVSPGFVKAGTKQVVTLRGVGLDKDVILGKDIKVEKVLKASPTEVVVEVSAPAAAKDGLRRAQTGGMEHEAGLVVYKKVDSIRIEPKEAMARVGGNGGPIPKKPLQFEAIAYTNGPDGKPKTDDDIRIGHMPAQWSLANLNKTAEAMKDLDYAGSISPDGLFMPNDAGPNPKRKYQTNNAGELKVTAKVQDGNRSVDTSTHLMVTVQRFVDPPIH